MSPSDISRNDSGQADVLPRSSFFTIVRRRWWVVLPIAVLVPAMALVVSLMQEKQYEAKAGVLLGDPASGLKKNQPVAQTDPERRAQTAVDLSQTDQVAEATARALGPKFDADDVSSAVDVASTATSDVLTVTATDSSPEEAARIANTFSKSFVQFRTGLESLQRGGAKVVEEATVPKSPTSPRPLFNTILGLALGIPLALGLAFLLDRFDQRLRRPAEFETLLGAPLLGRVSKSKELAAGVGPADLPPAQSEAFQMIRANLRYLAIGSEIDSVLITSTAPEDGKSTVALNLAVAAAKVGNRALLIEGDLRDPSLAAVVGDSSGKGLASYLVGDSTLADAIVKLELPDEVDGEGHASLDVLLAGATPPNPPRLLESERMTQLLEHARRDYDLVVVDAPPIPVVSDGITLVDDVSGVIVVGRVGRDTRGAIEDLREQLAQIDASVLGVVANFATDVEGGYKYYGYGRPEELIVKSEDKPPAPPEDPEAVKFAVGETNGSGTEPTPASAGDRPAS